MNAKLKAQKMVARWLAEEVASLSGKTVEQVFRDYDDTLRGRSGE